MSESPGLRVVAFGGGHGLHATLTALRPLVVDGSLAELTAVVTVADNGGSSGRLREEFDVLPPGDLRMALAALCGTDDWGQTWARVMQHRFAGEGEMKGHSLGNLLIVGLWELLGDHVAALDWVGRLLGASGRVLPMALVPMEITAQIRGVDPARPNELSVVRGQVEVATSEGVIESIALDPANPPAAPEALAAIAEADWIFLGPGSWFTSVIPHLCVPAIQAALRQSTARVAVVLNLADQPGETSGFSPVDHLDVLLAHAPGLAIDVVIADRGSVGSHEQALAAATVAAGAELVLTDVAVETGQPHHDPAKLGATVRTLLTPMKGSSLWQ